MTSQKEEYHLGRTKEGYGIKKKTNLIMNITYPKPYVYEKAKNEKIFLPIS